MASFRLRKQAKDWFRHVRGGSSPVKTDFDIFYFCLVAGLREVRSNESLLTSEASEEFYDTFPEDYRASSRLIIGLLVKAELGRQRVNADDRAEVRRLFKELVDPQSPNFLSSDGMRALNAYASGGFDFLSSRFSDLPRSLGEFLIQYCKILKGEAA